MAEYMVDISSLRLDHLIDLALEEDIGPGDISAVFIEGINRAGQGRIVAKQDLIVAGLDVAGRVFAKLDPQVVFSAKCADGEKIENGRVMAEVRSSLKVLLMGERTALNFLQRMSGIATHVRDYMDLILGASVRLVDTRKTIPGWRALEKYAVRVGGGHNHRMGLFDGVLLKDNHIAAAGSIARAVDAVRGNISHLCRIEVEVTNMDEVVEAIDAGADIIMLDNMNIDEIRKAVRVINGRAIVEVSGGVIKERLRELADAGVDIISSGALTHSATAVDISMKITPAASHGPAEADSPSGG